MSITTNKPTVGQVANVQFGNEWDTRGFHIGRGKIIQIQDRTQEYMPTLYLVEEIDDGGKPTGLVGVASATTKGGVDLVCTNARVIGASTHGGIWTRESSFESLGFKAE